MKTTLILAAFLAASSSITFGAGISVSMAVNTAAVTSTGTLLGNTYQARVGRYSGPALTTTTTASQILSGWTSVGSVAFATGAANGYNGYFDTGLLNFSDALGLAGTPVFVWLTDGADNNAVFTGLATNFLSDAAIPNSNSVSIEATTIAPATFLLGSYNAAGVSPNGGGTVILNNAIPEPSAALLGAIGALGLLRRRRI